jgi:hypothetical protein
MKASEAVSARLAQLLSDAQAAMDEVKRQQGATGGFERANHVELSGKVGTVKGFLAGLEVVGVTEIPIDLLERFGQLAEDARSVLYRDRRSETS